MRKVILRWRISSLAGAKELSKILEVAERVEILGHLALGPDSVTQLAEIKMREGHSVEEISEFDSFEVIEQHEEDEDGVLVSLLCTHPLAVSAIEMSNIHVQPPYGIDAERGMELRVSGHSKSISRFLALLRLILPPDKVSVQSLRGREKSGWTKNLTKRQQEVVYHAVKRGYYESDSEVTLRELADELGMARSTLGEHLQRAEEEIMKMAADDIG
tara:strand:+ start:1140 stop:1787 length:648 start_codon:yes stop_codon:yes gene_type:complete